MDRGLCRSGMTGQQRNLNFWVFIGISRGKWTVGKMRGDIDDYSTRLVQFIYSCHSIISKFLVSDNFASETIDNNVLRLKLWFVRYLLLKVCNSY